MMLVVFPFSLVSSLDMSHQCQLFFVVSSMFSEEFMSLVGRVGCLLSLYPLFSETIDYLAMWKDFMERLLDAAGRWKDPRSQYLVYRSNANL